MFYFRSKMSTQISIAYIALQTKRESALSLNLTFINLCPFFQRVYEAWTEKLKTRFIESILLLRAMNPIWTVENDTDGSLEVLDGMHRITTALNFFNNEFKLDSDSLCGLDKERYKNKRFSDLTDADKNKIRQYNFTFNHLDSSYRNDPNKLQEMYEILNASSKPLNKHELHKPIYKPFYDLISDNPERWYDTPLFKKSKSVRGSLETELTKIISLSEERLPESFSSINDIATKWESSNLGDSTQTVTEFIRQNGINYKTRLDRIKKIMDKFSDVELFSHNDTEDHIVTLIIIARTTALIKKDAIFSRHLENLVHIFKTELMDGHIQDKLECPARNAIFQRKLIDKVDTLIRNEIGDKEEPRRFSKEIIEQKLKDQKRVCPICTNRISEQQKYEGDHIIPWGQMGRTVAENCQVVHLRCHKKKC